MPCPYGGGVGDILKRVNVKEPREMDMEDKLSIAFVWHMHQPLYKDLLTGKYYLPWVRLHSTYSYYDMISILDDFPEVKVTFNMTASLIWQLLDISGDHGFHDEYLILSKKPAEELEPHEKEFILKNFFSCDFKNAILPVERYHELFKKRGDSLKKEDIRSRSKNFSVSDLRDLQVLFNLAWCGFTLRRKNEHVKKMAHKARSFTEDEKIALLNIQQEVVSSILPAYKRMQDEDRVEISTSPFYHPILPLLCGIDERGDTAFLEDAREQIKRAILLYEEVFLRKPPGMWPPEAGVSRFIVPPLADEGIKWIASDEGVLLESFKDEGFSREELLYKPFKVEEASRKIDMVFRDARISNAIGFKYASLSAKDAVSDLMDSLKSINKTLPRKKGPRVVSIILDGENPWPYFQKSGADFLSRMYEQISSHKQMRFVTVSGFLNSNRERTKIKKLYAGSWIDRNFDKWIGSAGKKLAWKCLEKAKKEMISFGDSNAEALEELYIAEGSDWFWWYDDFGTNLNFIFDELYRLHLSNIYSAIGRRTPYYLESPLQARSPAKNISGIDTPLEMASVTKVLIVSSECIPFAKTGGLADFSASLAKTLGSFGCDVSVIMPLYKCVRDAARGLIKEPRHIKTSFFKDVSDFELYSARTEGVTVYFVRNDKYFERDGLYGTDRGDYQDNALRFGFFSKAVLCAIRHSGFKPDIVHCNDWQSALIPFYLKYSLNFDDYFKNIKTLFTIHNMAYQGVFDKMFLKKLDISESFFNMHNLEFYGMLNFLKSGILYSDAVNTVSERYAREIMTPEYGASLDGLMRAEKDKLYGIPNGADYSVWNAENDSFIKTNYNAKSIEKKIECKKDLLEYANLSLPPRAPIVGCVTRLADQKGMDLFAGIIDKIVQLGCGIVILGRGTRQYNELFSSLMEKFPKNVYVCNEFNDELAHKIEAGADIFVMPSRYEPCGLNQMYSLKYGTVPVVRATGGLDDAIADFDEDRDVANGFKFGAPSESAFLSAVQRAVEIYKTDQPAWKNLMLNGMKCNFSWDESAKKYLTLYRKIMM